MKTIILKRVASSDGGMQGVLMTQWPDIAFAVTYELPWHDNKQDISCIPEGEYICQSIQHPNKGIVYRVQSVPGRDSILIHIGNNCKDSKGCILVGDQFEPINGEAVAIGMSSKGFMDLRNIILPDIEFRLVIKRV
jgi:hypothetical protein